MIIIIIKTRCIRNKTTGHKQPKTYEIYMNTATFVLLYTLWEKKRLKLIKMITIEHLFQ